MPADENSKRTMISASVDQTKDAQHVLVTDLVPSEIACLASSPGRMRRTEVWISRDEMVDFFEYEASSTDKGQDAKLGERSGENLT